MAAPIAKSRGLITRLGVMAPTLIARVLVSPLAIDNGGEMRAQGRTMPSPLSAEVN